MIRCSSISKIMTEPRGKKEREAGEFSETAKSAMLEQVREDLFGVRKDLDSVKCIQKGRMLEDDGVELYNRVFLYDLEKVPSDGRRNNGIITGEPDLVAATSNKGVDIKCSWDLLTFPLNASMAAKKEYEWQARGYMCLFDLPKWEIAYCMLDTPDELLNQWDDESLHRVDDAIPEHHRITIATYERDMELEKSMLEKCAKANEWIDNAIKNFAIEHNQYIGE